MSHADKKLKMHETTKIKLEKDHERQVWPLQQVLIMPQESTVKEFENQLTQLQKASQRFEGVYALIHI